MKFGVAKEIITPYIKTKVACCGKFDVNFENIHDDVYARCIIFDDGKNKVITMVYDLLFHDRSLNVALKEYAFEKYGIVKDAVCISYTHAHTAPASKGYNPEHHNNEYEEFLIERGKSCIDKAINSMFEGTIEYGSADIDLNISRRGINKDGKYDNIPNFDYEHDTELFVLCIKDTNKNVKSVLVNYAAHPVFYPSQLTISSEYPGRLCNHLENNYYGSIALFTQSAGGDVRPSTTVTQREDGSFGWKPQSFDGIDAYAQSLCKKVLEILNGENLKSEELSLNAKEFSVTLAIDGKPIEVFQKEWAYFESRPDSPNRKNADLIVHGGYENLPDSMKLFCQTIRITDNLYIATTGGEPCYGIKQLASEVFKGHNICFIGYTDACAYLPDDKVLEEGGYEAECHLEYGHKGPFKKGINKLLTDGFLKSLEQIS